jgi:hypothetical protein
MLLLADGSEEALDPSTVRLGAGGGPAYCAVKGGRFQARLSPAAWSALGERIEEERGVAWLVVGGARHRLGTV